MRHLWSLLSAIGAVVLAMALFAIDPSDVTGRLQIGRIIVAGLVLGLVAATRISPVGPIVGGLLLLAPAIIMEVSSDLGRTIFLSGYGTDLGGLTLTWADLGRMSGYMALAGAMMIVAAVSRQRWRAWPKPVDGLVDNGSDEPVTAAGPAAGAHDGITEQLWIQPR